jgi:hypothetical protein
MYDCVYMHSNYINMQSIFHMPQSDPELFRKEYY